MAAMKTKITALIDEQLIETTKTWAHATNTTQAITIALQEWCAMKALKQAHEETQAQPLEFHDDFSAEAIRAINRQQ